jgi:hypothetical protein
MSREGDNMIRLIYGLLALMFTMSSAQAIIPIKREVGINAKGSLSRKVYTAENTKGRVKELFGTWTTNSSSTANDSFDYEIRINSVTPARTKGLSFVNYDVKVDGAASDDNLNGYLVDNKLFFTVSFLNGYSSLIAVFDKNFMRAEYAESFIIDRNCGYYYTDASFGDLYVCAFPVSEVGATDGGSMDK